MQIIKDRILTIQSFAPADTAVVNAKFGRQCHKLPDDDWIRMGIRRVLGDVRSGREFLQQWNLEAGKEIGVVNFFDTASSARRLRLVGEVNEAVASAM